LRTIRWALVLLLAPLGYVAAVLLAILLTQLLVRLCPQHLLVSGMCTASWYTTAEVAAFAFATAVGAALWVVLPSLVAPAHRSRVAWVAFVLGAAYATWFMSQVGMGFAVPFACAVVSGAVAAVLVWSRYRHAA